jgi:uncharacterized protein
MLADHLGVPQLRDLASRSEHYRDTVPVSDMARLTDVLHPDFELQDKKLDLQIEFLGGMQGFPELSGHIGGSLEIVCQRCLGSLEWPVEIDFRLVVISSEEDFDEVAEPFDTVIAGEHGIRLSEIVEDELLGSLPLAPMHDEDDCKLSTNADPAMEKNPDGEEMNRPFGNLAALIEQAAEPDRKN